MPDNLSHLFITGTGTTEQYTYAGGIPRVEFQLPPRDSRPSHAGQLRTDLEQAQAAADAQTPPEEAEQRRGITLEFEGEPGFDLAVGSLENRRQGIELANVRQSGNLIRGTVFIPEGKVDYFFGCVDAYANRQTTSGAPRHRRLIESISKIRLAAVEAFWTDDPQLFPRSGEEIWWEVWIRTGPRQADQDVAFADFVAEVADLPIQLGGQSVRFPERVVFLAKTTVEQWARSLNLLNRLAELRRAKEVPTQYLQLPLRDQAEVIRNARARLEPPAPNAPAVCLLDTGVNRAHPLLELATDERDVLSCNQSWSATDHVGHGTEMAGISLYGCLTSLFGGSDRVTLTHRLESVKILPAQGQNDPEHYGAITQEAIARAEVSAPRRLRSVCLAVTSDDRDGGLPTSWSAAVDQTCAGGIDDLRRFVCVSAGNVPTGPPVSYPLPNRELYGIQDPAQSWNALTVSAYTERVHISTPEWQGWQPVAPHGALSPTSTTSLPWPWEDAPLKPDIVMEGGNCAVSQAGETPHFVDDLSLLTTSMEPTGRMLTTAGETSAAVAQAARIGAIVQGQYPAFWPETVRGLLVHAARWTQRMLDEFPYEVRDKRLRVYGLGVPSLERTLWSASNSATLVIQDELQPFDRDNGTYRTKDMRLHTLPWPVDVLESLGSLDVSMRVTLSYFVEPSPGRRGWTRRHRYQSHGLRFDVKRPTETVEEFRRRLSKDAWEDPDVRPEVTSESHNWELGRNLRTRGSIHSDVWHGSAADLAASGQIGIHPVTGWWRERPHLDRWSRKARYALIVSIATPRTDVDLYSAIQNQVAVSQQIEIL